jgi:aminodeoxyfutalosine synthase
MSLDHLRKKIEEGEPLSFDDGVALYSYPNLLDLAALANQERERLYGARTTFNRNLHINPTNVCVAQCRLCSFSRRQASDPGAYTMTAEQACTKLRARLETDPKLTEVHIVAGLNESLPLSYHTDLLAALKQVKPDLHIKAYSAVEIFQFHKQYGLSIEDVFAHLRVAGLDSMPGGGAEIFAPRVRQRICPGKCDADQWLNVHRIAHRLGIKSNCTMLYGTFETVEERVLHMLRLRDLQDETGGFQAFIPLAFHPAHNPLSHLHGPTGTDDLRTMAVARLLLHNIPHIKAYWVSLGLKTAQTALWFGADDLDGTVQEEKIYHEAGSDTPQSLSAAEIARVIRDACRVPVERDTLYNTIGVAE